MPRKKTVKRKPSRAATDAALLLVEHRDAKGGMGRRNEHASEAASALAARRMSFLSKKQKTALGRKGGKAYWGDLTPEEVSIEQRRRAKVRAANRKKALKAKLGKG